MRVLYIGCHEVLEWSELRILTEMNEVADPGFPIEVFSLNGAFMNPTQSGGYTRTVIPKGRFYPDLYGIGLQSDKDNIHPELLDWCDVVFMTHNSAIPGQKEQQRWLVRNWDKIKAKNKKVVWRSIGQCTPAIEKELNYYRQQGLKIVRCSPIEDRVPDYCGADAVIRFSEDPDEFNNWNGEKKQVITMAQSFKKRGDHLGFSLFEKVTHGFNPKVIGTDNQDLGDLWVGQRSYRELIDDLRQSRAFFYFGTIPVPYTLSFVEAMMVGVPIVAAGAQLRKHFAYPWSNYEVPEIISNGVNGFVSDNIDELRGYIDALLKDDALANRISEAGRKTAIELFGKKQRMAEWGDLLRRI